MLPDGLVAEEGEYFVFQDRAADAAADLIKAAGISQIAGSAVIGLIRVEAGTVSGDEEASVIVIGAALGSNLDRRAAEAAILGVVIVGHNLEAFDGFFRRGDDGRSTPNRAGRADAVNGNAVVWGLLSVGADGRAVLSVEDSLVGALCSAAGFSARKVVASSAAALGTIAEDAGSQLRELEDVASG